MVKGRLNEKVKNKQTNLTTIENRVQWVELIQTTDCQIVNSSFQHPTFVHGYRGPPSPNLEVSGIVLSGSLSGNDFLLSPLIIFGLRSHDRVGFIISAKSFGPSGFL